MSPEFYLAAENTGLRTALELANMDTAALRTENARLREACSQLLGHQHNLKAFAGTMLRWNKPGVDFSDEARRICEHAEEWHRILVEALAPPKAPSK